MVEVLGGGWEGSWHVHDGRVQELGGVADTIFGCTPTRDPMSSPLHSPPARLGATWLVLVAALGMALVGLVGGLGSVDESVQRALVGDQAAYGRPHPQLVVIDEATLDRLGPPPWDAPTWWDIDRALQDAGVQRAHVVDGTETLVRGEAPTGGASVLRLPTVVRRVRGQPRPSMPTSWGPIVAEDLVLDLPTTGGSVVGVGDRAASSRSALCRWSPCPSGPDLAAPLSASDAGRLRRVSLTSVLDGQALGSDEDVLLGITASGWASTLPVGPRGLVVTWPEAVGLAVAAASGPRIPTPGPLLLAPLLAVVVLLGGLASRAERVLPAEAWVMVVPLLAGGGGALLVSLHIAVLPVVSLALAGLLGPLFVALAARQRALRFVRRAALEVARGDLGFAWEDGLDGSPEGVLRALGSLTRNHLPADRTAWLVPGRRGWVDLVGGYGLTREDLRLDGVNARQLEALSRRSRVPGLRADGSDRLVLVPVHERSGQVRGWWAVAWEEGDEAPDLDLLVDLAGWVERRLDGSRPGGPRSWLRVDGELRAIGTAFARSAEARAAQARMLAEADLPLATADRAGAIVFRNAAWKRLLDLKDLPREPMSLRELAWRLGGEAYLDARMRRLFVERLPVVLGTGPDAVTLAPAGEGFVAWSVPPARLIAVEPGRHRTGDPGIVPKQRGNVEESRESAAQGASRG